MDLEQLVEDIISHRLPDAYTIACDLMAYHKLPFALAEKLARAWRWHVDFGHELLSREDATPEALDAWADSDNLHSIRLIARHPRTTLETLIKLTQHPEPMATHMAILSGRLPETLVDSYVSSEEPEIRLAVATMSRSASILRRLSEDSEQTVIEGIAANPATESALISQIAEQNPLRSEWLGRTLASRLEDPLLLAKYATHHSAEVRLAVAMNPHVSERTLSDLARKERFPNRTMHKVLSARLKDPEALRRFHRNAAKPYITVEAKSSNPAKYKYRVRMQPIPGKGTKVTIFANGSRIVERTTWFRNCFAAVCSHNVGYILADYKRWIANLQGRIRLCERVITGENEAWEEYRRAIWSTPETVTLWQEGNRDPEKIEAAFRLRAEAIKAELAKVEDTVDQIVSGQHPALKKIWVRSWHRRRDCVRKPGPAEVLVDVLEISVPDTVFRRAADR